jgi:hypothetical protein
MFSSDNIRDFSSPSVTPEDLTQYQAFGKAGRLLQRIRERPDSIQKELHHWSGKTRHPELAESLCRSLLVSQIAEAVRTLEVLRGERHYISRVGNHHSMEIPVALQTTDSGRTFGTDALVDSGATGCYIDEAYARSLGLNLEKLSHTIPIYNADNSLNENGPIRYVVTLRMNIKDHVESISLAVTNLGRSEIILGHAWLQHHNPSIDWRAKKLVFDRCPRNCTEPQLWHEEVEERIADVEERSLVDFDTGERLMFVSDINPTSSGENQGSRVQSHKTTIPDRYLEDFGSIFEKENFNVHQ